MRLLSALWPRPGLTAPSSVCRRVVLLPLRAADVPPRRGFLVGLEGQQWAACGMGFQRLIPTFPGEHLRVAASRLGLNLPLKSSLPFFLTHTAEEVLPGHLSLLLVVQVLGGVLPVLKYDSKLPQS